MMFQQLFDSESSTYTYLVADAATREAALFDPVRDEVHPRYLPLLRDLSLRLVYVFDTHVHADHITGAAALRDATGARTALHELAGAAGVDVPLRDGQVLLVGAIAVRALHTPGHTPCHVSYLVNGDRVLTGDALLIGGCGRTDFQGGDAEVLYDSVTGRLFGLPGDTVVYPGHDYRGNVESTIAAERRTNSRFAGRSREEFVELMRNLGLPPPRRIAEAVPANRLCGRSNAAVASLGERLPAC